MKPWRLAAVLLTLLLVVACTKYLPPNVDYSPVTAERGVHFPRDHYAHHDFRTEWWYHTGHFETVDGHRYGFELVFFRHRTEGLVRFGLPVWKFVNPIHFAHFAITDETNKTFDYAEHISNEYPRLGGSREDALYVWTGSWRMEGLGETTRLVAAMPDGKFAVDLLLTPKKPPVVHGVDGVSTKGADSDSQSYYISVTRYDVAGTMRRDGAPVQVKNGQAWMDHEIFSKPISKHIVGWDWFSIQLDNDHDIMAFLLHRRDGTVDADSSGTIVYPDGRYEHFTADEFTVAEKRHWTSPRTDTKYPVDWRLTIPKYDADLTVTAALDDQELIQRASGITYWEGAMHIRGDLAGEKVHGQGYVEMSGRSGEVPGL